MHDNATNNSRITIRTAGTYEVGGAVRFSANATGARQVAVRLNGTTFLVKNQQSPLASSATDCATPVIPYVFSVGDYIELVATQSSGGNLATVAAPEVTFLRAKLVSS
jgi:D-serine deaminase-like pyridoxal phosphate-dependent protein